MEPLHTMVLELSVSESTLPALYKSWTYHFQPNFHARQKYNTRQLCTEWEFKTRFKFYQRILVWRVATVPERQHMSQCRTVPSCRTIASSTKYHKYSLFKEPEDLKPKVGYGNALLVELPNLREKRSAQKTRAKDPNEHSVILASIATHIGQPIFLHKYFWMYWLKK